jgi:transposase
VEDWAEVQRLFRREGLSKAAIARQLGMSRNTVARLLRLREAPAYQRPATGSLVDPFAEQIAALLTSDPKAPATVIWERLRADGYTGGISILKAHLASVRPGFLAARAYQRTSYRPGEIGQVDWWHTGVQLPVGREQTREAFGLVVNLPHCGASSVVFTLGRTLGDLRPALVGCLARLGGVPEKLVFDNDAAVVAERVAGKARLHAELSSLLGALRSGAIVLQPRRPWAKGGVERAIGYLETSFLPLRTFADLDDLQAQADDWLTKVAARRHLRRLGASVAAAWAVERGFLQPLPDPLLVTDLWLETRVGKDAFVRVAGADYSVPPAFVGRRVSVRLSPAAVEVRCEGVEIASHHRSFVPADVVLSPAHGRAIRLAREARDRLVAGDPELPPVDLARYDALVGVTS